MWDEELPGCFGENDLVFANGPSERDRAFAWVQDLRKRKVGWKEARKQIVAFLRDKGTSEERIKEEVRRAKKAIEFWLPV